ncbi:MAG: YetF domain-containing protein [Chitinophagaceae bacterium]
MYLLNADVFDWQKILLGDQNWSFLVETVLRTFIMFLVMLLGLTILGKRGVKQLSIFELIVIIGLGSAAGDPMFYNDVGILPAIVVFTIIISLYVLITYLVGKSRKLELLLEGKPVCLISEGRFSIDNFKKEPLAQDEFFSELRMQSVSHLGQIDQAIVETSGNISLFFYDNDDVKYGLPIMPDSLDTKTNLISESGYYACSFCGFTEQLQPAKKQVCTVCNKEEWVKASNKQRVP